MYPEGPEEWKQPHHVSGSTYISNVSASQQDIERLMRENERLKAGLEKEKFFNKLLDQELKEVKAGIAESTVNQHSRIKSGVSKGAFYTLLLVTLAMAGFIGYTLYFNKQYHLFPDISASAAGGSVSTTETPDAEAGMQENLPAAGSANELTQQPAAGAGLPTATAEATGVSTTEPGGLTNDAQQTQGNVEGATNTPAGTQGKPANGTAASGQLPVTPPPAQPAKNPVNASASNSTNPPASGAAREQVAAPDNQETSRQAGNAARQNDTRNQDARPPAAAAPSGSVAATNPTPATPPVAQPSAPPLANRPVIGRYRVTSKANFYTSADENTLRSTFISPGTNRIVNAVEDRNGFILVSYKNDAGHVTTGWLSKKDLTEVK